MHHGLARDSLEASDVTAPSYTATWTVGGITWYFEVEAFCSDQRSARSAQVSAVADPTCAPGPSNIRVTSTKDGVDFVWDAVEGFDVVRYGAIYWDSTRDAFLTNLGWTGTSASYGGMVPGDRLITAIETWANVDGVVCAGLPQGGQEVIVGGVTPGPPTGFKVATINEGATVQLSWDADDNAFAYGFYMRSLLKENAPYELGGYTAAVPCLQVTFLIPGAWNFEFCAFAINGNSTSPTSDCIVAPRDITSPDQCPSPAPTGPPEPNPNPTVPWTNPTPTRISPGGGGGGDGDGEASVVYIDPVVLQTTSPTAACEPPCTLVLPPWTVPTTTISFPPATEIIEETWPEATSDGTVIYGTTTVTVVITMAPITTTRIPVSNVVISTGSSSSTSGVIILGTSLIPDPVTLTQTPHGNTWTYSPGPVPPHTGPPPGSNPTTLHISLGPPAPCDR